LYTYTSSHPLSSLCWWFFNFSIFEGKKRKPGTTVGTGSAMRGWASWASFFPHTKRHLHQLHFIITLLVDLLMRHATPPSQRIPSHSQQKVISLQSSKILFQHACGSILDTSCSQGSRGPKTGEIPGAFLEGPERDWDCLGQDWVRWQMQFCLAGRSSGSLRWPQEDLPGVCSVGPGNLPNLHFIPEAQLVWRWVQELCWCSGWIPWKTWVLGAHPQHQQRGLEKPRPCRQLGKAPCHPSSWFGKANGWFGKANNWFGKVNLLIWKSQQANQMNSMHDPEEAPGTEDFKKIETKISN